MKDVLIAKNLSKKYKRQQIVKDVSFSIQQGEIIGILGPNGAGKTTCFYMVLGIVPVGNGEICLNKKKITYLPIHERAHLGIGYLAQEPSIFRKLAVKDNILAILELNKKISREEQYQQMENLLNEFNIFHLRNHIAMGLSGGERRRLEIARCIANKPKFILLDEPFAGVDPISIIEIKSIIKKLSQQGIGIFITDHNVRETLDICHRAFIINKGQVIASGDSEQILNDNQVRQVYLGVNFSL